MSASLAVAGAGSRGGDAAAHGAGGAGSRIAWVLAGLAGGAGWIALRSGHLLPALLPACAFREVFGIGCATCGFTRALTCLARGDAGASFAAHPLAIPVVIEVALAWLLWGLGSWIGWPVLRGRSVARAVTFTAITAVVTWVVRLATGGLPG